jgi:hypothetical protein
MWLFTTRGFLSIVQNKDNPDLLHVRARVKEDIDTFAELVWGLMQPEEKTESIEVSRTDYGDYLYRFDAPREAVARAVQSIVGGIDYTNFKASVEDTTKTHDSRVQAYFKVWNAMSHLQDCCDGGRMQ